MLELIIHGGWAMGAIVLFSITMIAIVFERYQAFNEADIDSQSLLDEVSAKLATGNVDEAMTVCSKVRSPVADTLRIGLRKLVFLERIGKRPEEIEEGIVSAMEEHSAHVQDWLERNLSLLATVASMAPMIGMFGTVVGMIKAFGSIGSQGAMTPEGVGAGIAEALICTASGLFVAIIATVFYNYFTTRVNRFVLQMQEAGTELVEKLLDLQTSTRPAPAAKPSPVPAPAAPRVAPPRPAPTPSTPTQR